MKSVDKLPQMADYVVPRDVATHKVNECVSADDLDTLSLIHEEILVELLA